MGIGRRPGRGRLALATAAVAALASGALAACTPTPSAPVPTATSISDLSVSAARTATPVTATIRWRLVTVPGRPVTCRLDTDGDGTDDRTVPSCPSQGDALVQYTTPGTVVVRLAVDDGVGAPSTRTVAVNAVAGSTEPFDITLEIAPSMPAELRGAFEVAAARWERVITTGWASEQLSIPEGFLGWMPAFDGQVDDLLIEARAIEMDGPRNLLGHAGALLYRSSNGQPYFGVMEFDTADLDRLASLGRLDDVVTHEMGHVLGLGANWALEGRLDDLLTDPTYNGPAGVAAWHELGGTGKVPVEDQGGAGTAIAHWRESTFNDELMTGYSDPDERLSRLTVAALADRGYGVDLSAAEPYTLPPQGAAVRSPSAEDDIGHVDPVAPLAGPPA